MFAQVLECRLANFRRRRFKEECFMIRHSTDSCGGARGRFDAGRKLRRAPNPFPPTSPSAVADSNRPDADKQRDANRKPAETLGIRGRQSRARRSREFLPGGGYFTRIFSKAVGSAGHVYALVPERPADAPADMADFAAKVKAIAADPNYSNVTVVVQPWPNSRPPVPSIWCGPRRTIMTCTIFPGSDVDGIQQADVRFAEAGRHLSGTGSCRRRRVRARGIPRLCIGSTRKRSRRKYSRRASNWWAAAISASGRRRPHSESVRPVDSRQNRSVHIKIS